MANQFESGGGLPFAIAMRGYDRDQVNEFYRSRDAEMRVIAADRDAATANASELAQRLEDARDEIDELRREVDHLSVPPTTVEGMSDRMSRMLRLASDEAADIRESAGAEAAETLSVARQEAEQLRNEAGTLAEQTRIEQEDARRELSKRRAAMEGEHEATMQAAHDEASRIVEAAKAEAERLDTQAQINRDRIQEDFDTTMAARRDKAIALVNEMETSSTNEAKERVDNATAEAERIRQHSHSIATERIKRSHELSEQIRQLRGRMLGQLDEIRQQLDDVPNKLRGLDDERDLLETDTHDLLNGGLSKQAQLRNASNEGSTLRHQAGQGEASRPAPPRQDAPSGRSLPPVADSADIPQETEQLYGYRSRPTDGNDAPAYR